MPTYRYRSAPTPQKPISLNPGSIPSVARDFIIGKPKLPISNKYNYLKHTDTEIEICFPQYSRPWQGYLDSEPINYFSNSLNKTWRHVFKLESDGHLYYSTYNGAVTPGYLHIYKTPRSNRIICDYAATDYKRDVLGVNILRDMPKMRLWTHVELAWNSKSGHHGLDKAKSWIAFNFLKPVTFRNNDCIGYKKLTKFQDNELDAGTVFPWAHLGALSYTPKNKQWYIKFTKDLSAFINKHFVIAPKTSQYGEYKWDGLSIPGNILNIQHSVGFKYVVTGQENPAKVFEFPNLVSHNPIKFHKALYKYACRLIADSSVSIFDVNAFNKTDKIIGQLRNLVYTFDDPSVLHHVNYDTLLATIKGSSYLSFGRVPAHVLADELWLKFPRAKQYRFACEAVFERQIPYHLVDDLGNMLEEIHDHPDGGRDATAKVIDTRDIKSWTDYHDEVTKVYNKIRYAPKPIKPALFQPILDAGLNIPDTNMRLVIPEHTNEIREWGTVQKHCIGSYADDCYAGICLLMGVWDDKAGSWVGHLQMYPIQPAAWTEWRKPKANSEYGSDSTAVITWNSSIDNPYMLNAANTNYTYNLDLVPKANIRQFYAKFNHGVEPVARQQVINYLNAAVEKYVGRYKDGQYLMQYLSLQIPTKRKTKTNA